MSKKTLGWTVAVALIVALVVVVLFQNGNEQPPDGSSRLKIGAAIALTGYGAAFGESERDAIELLKEKYPDAEFFVEDNKSGAKAGLLAVNKLIDVHGVDVVYCDLTTVANSSAAVTKEREVVLIASVYLTDLLDRSPYAVRNLPRGIDESRLLLEHLQSQHPDAKRIVAVGSNDEFGRSSLSDFREAASGAGVDVIAEDVIPDSETHIASFAQAIAAKGPDAVYAASLMPSLGLFIREMRVAGFEGVILTTDAFGYPYIRAAAGEHAKGTVYVDFSTTAATEDFAKRYESSFSKDLTPTAVLCYDGLSIVIDAWGKANGKAPSEVVSEDLEGWEHEGVYGQVHVQGREIIYPLETRIAQ